MEKYQAIVHSGSSTNTNLLNMDLMYAYNMNFNITYT